MIRLLFTIYFMLITCTCFAQDVSQYDIEQVNEKTGIEYAGYAMQNVLDNKIIPMNRKMDYEGQSYYWGTIWQVYEERFSNHTGTITGKYNTKDKLHKKLITENTIYVLGNIATNLDMGCDSYDTQTYPEYFRSSIKDYVGIQKLNTMEQLALAQRISIQILAFRMGKVKFQSSDSYHKYVLDLICVAYNMSGQARRLVATSTMSLVNSKGSGQIEQIINKYLYPMTVKQ